MQGHAAVFRNAKSTGRGRGKDEKGLERHGGHVGVDRSLVWNSDLMEALELHNLMGNAMTTMVGAEARTKAAAPTPMTTIRARRCELDEAHAGLVRRRRRREARLSPGEDADADQRGVGHSRPGSGFTDRLRLRGVQ